VILFNRSASAHKMSVDWSALNMAPGEKADVRDLWSKAVSKGVKASYTADVPSHGVVMVRVSPAA
jgi:alpha-galactosidase